MPTSKYLARLDSARRVVEVPAGAADPQLEPGDVALHLGLPLGPWGPDHVSATELEALRMRGDALADAAVAEIVESGRAGKGVDALGAVREAAAAAPDSGCARFLAGVSDLPAWVDWAAVDRGQMVLVRNPSAAGFVLLYLSLAGGFGAPRINATLTSTGYLTGSTKRTFRRLIETVKMIVDCVQSNGLRVGGVGWESTVRVRLLHAQVRHWLRRLPAYDQAAFGIPINQEDTVATQISFSFNVLYGLDIAGIPVSTQEAEDYVHLWRVIGYLVGVDEDVNPCTSFGRCRAVADSIALHLLNPDETSRAMTRHVLETAAVHMPTRWSFACHAEFARLFMGDGLADTLGLPPSRAYLRLYVRVVLALLRTWAWLTYLPWVGPRMLAASRSGMSTVCTAVLGKDFGFELAHQPTTALIGRAPADTKPRPRRLPAWTTIAATGALAICVLATQRRRV